MKTLTQQVSDSMAGKPHTLLSFHSHRATKVFLDKTDFDDKIYKVGATTVEFAMRINDKDMKLLIKSHKDLIYQAHPIMKSKK